MAQNLASNQPALVESADAADAAARLPAAVPSHFGVNAMSFAGVTALFWMGSWAAYLWGYLGVSGLSALDLPQTAMLAAAALMPPLLFFAVAAALARGAAMQRTAEAMMLSTEKLFAADETAARSAARLSRAVRRELDTLNTGLDAAFQRVRSLETLIEHQIAALDEAGARAEVRGDSIALRLGQETQRIEILSNTLSDAAVRAGETVSAHAAHMRGTIETAEDGLTQKVESLSQAMSDAALRANDTLAVRAAQMKTTLEGAESALTGRVEILSGNLGDAATPRQ